MASTAIPPVTDPRLEVGTLAPAVYRAQAGLDRAAAEAFTAAGLPAALLELVRLRASQLNGCAFCLDMHSKDARHAGEREERIYLLDAWREAPHYTDQERAALALCEAVTLVSEGQVSEEVWDAAAAVLSPAQLAAVVGATVAINGWNRIAISSRMTPGEYQPS